MPTAPVLQTLADLVRIPSVNPAYEGGVSEAGVVAWLREFCRGRGIETWETEVFPGRPNLVARLPGAIQTAASSSRPTPTRFR